MSSHDKKSESAFSASFGGVEVDTTVSILKNGESNLHIAVWELNGTSTNLEERTMEEI
jgi:hypothetical protein